MIRQDVKEKRTSKVYQNANGNPKTIVIINKRRFGCLEKFVKEEDYVNENKNRFDAYSQGIQSLDISS